MEGSNACVEKPWFYVEHSNLYFKT